MLEDGDDTLRPLVLEALGRIGGGGAQELVMAVAADSSASVTDRAFARAALDHMGEKPLVPRGRRARL